MNEYYIIPDIEAIKSEKDPETLRMHRRRIACAIGDADTLGAILGDRSEDFNDFYGDSELPQLTTEDTIDSFLKRFGKDEASPAEELVPVAPAIDYASMLEEEEASTPENADSTLGAIDAFLAEVPPTRIKPKKAPKEEEKPALSESFAKIMIKNGNYQRALEIITEISLNNSEKSIYFADQIRFLRKLVLLNSGKQASGSKENLSTEA